MRGSLTKSAVIIISLLGLGLAAPGTAAAGSGKGVTICHIPPGNSRNAHTIEINSSAVSAHLAHGDYLGECRPQVCSPGSSTSCYGGPAGTAGIGTCHEGTQTCNADGTAFGPCSGEVSPVPETCGDGLDSDCDGLADDGCVCAPGSSAPCYTGPSGTAGVGNCQAGAQTCNADGTGYGVCAGEVLPAAEACGDGIDNDCDGSVDENCLCTPGSTLACYDGPSGTAGVGVCSAGVATCASDGSSYGPCTGEVTPAGETCGDGIDNDCDGSADENCVCTPGSTTACYDGPAGTAGVGACSAGITTCTADGSGYGPCTGEITPSSETCGDAIDNDCDGQSDESCVCTPGSTAACYSGPPSTEDIGTCQSGTQICNSLGSAYDACIGEILPASEVCGDGLDNDCDGTSDDGCVCLPGSAAACYGGPSGTEGVGVCHAGLQTCNAAGTSYGACVGDVVPVAEVCGDSLDNDCDGVTDEGCIGNRAWRDTDEDGVQDIGEPGVAGVTFVLRGISGAVVAVAVSDLSGTYHFSNVPAGAYYVDVVPPSGLTVTAANAGPDDSLDSDFDESTLASPVFVLSVNTFDIDCGLKPVPVN